MRRALPNLRVGMHVGRAVLRCPLVLSRWVILCGCGAEAVRSSSTINEARREKRGVYCDACAADVRRLKCGEALRRAMYRARGVAARNPHPASPSHPHE